jgi:long-chain acyl-CoA synthetase
MNDEIISLVEKLKFVAEKNLERIILQEETEVGFVTYTYGDFLKNSQRIAALLKKLDIQKGDRVAMLLENGPSWGFAYFGILFSNGIAVPLDPHVSSEDIFYFLENSGSRFVFSSNKYLELFKNLESLATLKNIIITDDAYSPNEDSKVICLKKITIREEDLSQSFVPTKPEDIVSIIYTSGTTGKPKGVMLSNKNFYANYLSLMKLNFLRGDENILALLPLHHTFPFMTTLLIPLFMRLKITYPKTLKSDALLKCMQKAEITALISVPQFYYLFYENMQKTIKKIPWVLRWIFLGMLEIIFYLRKVSRVNLAKIILHKVHARFGKKMRFFISGGAKLDKSVQKFFFKLGFTIFDGYGLTETSPVVSFNLLKKFKIGSVGQAIPDVEIKIDEPNKEGIGEVLIKGSNVMLGYYQLPRETREVFRDGWFCSGDLGYLDSDNYLYIVARKNELIVLANGKNITPDELEEHYGRSSYIKELCILVVGAGTNEKLMAVIVPDFEYFLRQSKTNFYELIKWDLENFARSLPAFKHILGFILTKENLPKTRLGKLQRYLIKAKYQEELAGAKPSKVLEDTYSEEDLKTLSSPNGQKVFSALTNVLDRSEPIQLTDYLELDLGLDSLQRLELIVNLEKDLQIKIPEELLIKVFTVRDLVRELKFLLDERHDVLNESITATKKTDSIWHEILNESLSLPVFNEIDLSPNKMTQLATSLFDGFLYTLFRTTCRLKIFGQKNLTERKAFILCINHASYLDGFIIAAAIPKNLRNDLFFLGMAELLKAPILRNLQKVTRIIPIDPAEYLVPAMQAGAYILRHNKILAIFPEAARSIDGEVKEFKTGIGILLKEMNIPAIPVYINGSFNAWPRTKRFPVPYPITVTFGKPCVLEELQKIGCQLGIKDDYAAITEGLRRKIIELSLQFKKDV